MAPLKGSASRRPSTSEKYARPPAVSGVERVTGFLHQLPHRARGTASHHVGGAGVVDLNDVRLPARAFAHLDLVGHHFVVNPLEERHQAIVLLRGVVPRNHAVELGARRAAHRMPQPDLLRGVHEPRRHNRRMVRRTFCIGQRRVYSPSMAGVFGLTAAQLARAFSRKELSPVEVTRELHARIDAWEPRINALYRMDRNAALEQARAAEARWRAAKPLSAIDGVPLTIKENIHTRGDPAPIGTRANEDAPAQPATRRPRRACAKLAASSSQNHHAGLGMLSSGLSSLPACRNPWRLDRNTSGSSSVLRCSGRRLRAAPSRNRHRRLGPAARDALRHFRAQAIAGQGADPSALHGSRCGADDAHRRGRGTAHERVRSPTRATSRACRRRNATTQRTSMY